MKPTPEIVTIVDVYPEPTKAPRCTRARVGKFWLHTSVMERFAEAAAIFAALKFVPAKVEHHAAYNRFECCGWSPFFHEVEHGQVTPWYDLDVDGPGADPEAPLVTRVKIKAEVSPWRM